MISYTAKIQSICTFVFVLFYLGLIGLIDCRFTREPKCGNTKHFDFDSELPTYHKDLSFCSYYRPETCCNKTHTDKIIKNIYGYAGQNTNLTAECRYISLYIFISFYIFYALYILN